MSSFRRIALLLALAVPALSALQAQSLSSNAPEAPQAGKTQSQLSVQARIRARRDLRRANAIRDTYTHLYEVYAGSGYLRFTPGNSLERVNEKDWNAGFTRYYNERLGVTLDGRGSYGSAFIKPMPLNQGITKPKISEYAAMIGPNYRFYLQPKYSIAGRVMAGFAYGDFTGSTSANQNLSTYLGLYKDGYTYAASASVLGEYNVSPNVAIRVAPEYFATGFGSTQQNNLGFTAGVVVRFGKQ